MMRQTPPAKPRPFDSKSYKTVRTWRRPLSDAKDFLETGIASESGKYFHSHRTNSIEKFDMNVITAACKALPSGTCARVVSLEINRQTKDAINDRNAFSRGRAIDLSCTTSQKRGIAWPGTPKAEAAALSLKSCKSDAYIPASCCSNYFAIQIDSFPNAENAKIFKNSLSARYENVYIVVRSQKHCAFQRNRVGRCKTSNEARTPKERFTPIECDGVSNVAE